ncbi:MAG: nucleoside-diphosphate sugar epimerase/dehydratase [Chlorobium sp.]
MHSLSAEHSAIREKAAKACFPVCFGIRENILALPCYVKRVVAVAFDILSALLTVWMAFSLRLELFHIPSGKQWLVYILAPALMFPVFTFAGLYQAIHRYSGFAAFIKVVQASLVYGIIFFGVVLILKLPEVSLSVGVLQPMMFLLMTGGSRAVLRFWYMSIANPKKNGAIQERLLIYGAGSAGVEVVNAIHRSPLFSLAGFLDDDEQLHGRTINGMKVFSPEQAEELIEQQGVTHILLAIPSASRIRRNEIVEKFRKYPVRIQMLPGVEELADGRVKISDIKEIEIEDLLGRDPVPVDQLLVKKTITGKIVMVTGAGGSIGSELCRQLLVAQPSRLLLVDHAEYNLYTIHSDLEQRCLRLSSETSLVPLLGDVTDERRMDEICRVFEPNVIYHAAAYKHVPMVEHNPAEGVRNNVLGTLSIADVALKNGVPNVVLVSTDKAVRPTNVMGASKRLCEMILQALAEEPGTQTCFSMVRFGNVLGSSGSVVPLFRRQIKAGGPLTITHQEMTRYFMTIPEAAQLVIQAGAMASGGDVYLLDMGEPVKIIDLAHRMVELSGLSVRESGDQDGDIEIQVTGLRPGEKLYEELLIGNNPEPTQNPRIFKASEQFMLWSELQNKLEELKEAISLNDARNIKLLLKKLVPEYQPDPTTTDFLAIEEERRIVIDELSCKSMNQKLQSTGQY